MASTLAQSSDPRHLLLPERSSRMAKADRRKAEIEAPDWRPMIGAAIEQAQLACKWSLKELADKVQRDERQVSRWIAGTERPQMDALFAVEALRQPLVVALAALADGVEIVTQITVRRRA